MIDAGLITDDQARELTKGQSGQTVKEITKHLTRFRLTLQEAT